MFETIKVVSLGLAILFGTSILTRTAYKNDIPAGYMCLFSLTSTTFIYLQWLA